ncbi:MAG: hypothetical protein HUN04_25935 [Desulfobacter sp.]|nr:MAG: hypothetical protein HUN04_25935 [Desulfobacter sp.]
MILFCEDCGQKNDLEPAAFAGGRAVFKCSACGYHNAYALNVQETDSGPVKGFTPFFVAVQSLPGIIGSFLYHEKKGLVGEKMPPVLTRKDIESLGSGLSLGYSGGDRTFPDMKKMTVVISDKYFSVFKVAPQLYAIVVAAVPDLPREVIELVNKLGRGLKALK